MLPFQLVKAILPRARVALTRSDAALDAPLVSIEASAPWPPVSVRI
jgi:hypothetical protein